MTALAVTMWATAGGGVGALQARALFSQAMRCRSRLPVAFARLVLVCAFALFAVRARAPSALGGWVFGYAVAVASLARRLRRST